MNFGGFDAGIYTLSNPKKFSISPNNFLFVLDGKKIVVFDQYGNGTSIFNSELEFQGINIIYNNLTVNTSRLVMTANLDMQFSLKELSLEELAESTEMVSSLIFNNKLYILTPDKISIYIKTGF